MRKFFISLTSALLVVSLLIVSLSFNMVKAGTMCSSETESLVKLTDYQNGTRVMQIQYGNGTEDFITETFIRKTADFGIPEENRANQSLAETVTPSLEEPNGYFSVTQTLTTEQELLLGFTYNIAYLRREWNASGGWWIFQWEVKAGVIIDIRCGLRLPFNITFEYPSQITWGNNYTIYSILDPIDKLDFQEFLFTFKVNVWAEARIVGLPVPLTWVYGPDIDESHSFQTPLGPDSEVPLLAFDISLFETIKAIYPSFSAVLDTVALVFEPYLTLEPTFGSQKITATADALGDASVVEGTNLSWSTPGERLNFTVNINDHNENGVVDNVKIKLSDFRYYFTEFYLNLKLELDFNEIINALLGFDDPEINILTMDLSWLIEGLYAGNHPGNSRYVHVIITVARDVGPPEKICPRDIALISAIANPNPVYVGRIVNIVVTAINLGKRTETFNVTARCKNSTIGRHSVMQLRPGENATLIFLWNTTGLFECHSYKVHVEASIVPEEIDEEDNVLETDEVYIKMRGDINGDDIIDLYDAVQALISYGSQEGNLNWNEDVDLAPPYGKIDLYDFVTIFCNYGKTCP